MHYITITNIHQKMHVSPFLLKFRSAVRALHYWVCNATFLWQDNKINVVNSQSAGNTNTFYYITSYRHLKNKKKITHNVTGCNNTCEISVVEQFVCIQEVMTAINYLRFGLGQVNK